MIRTSLLCSGLPNKPSGKCAKHWNDMLCVWYWHGMLYVWIVNWCIYAVTRAYHTMSINNNTHITVMYNGCFGGFGLSRVAIQAYNARRPQDSPPLTNVDDLDRTDPLMIQIVQEFGTLADTQGSEIQLFKFPVMYKDFWSIKEHDGNEWVYIDYNEYYLHRIEQIMNTASMSETEKLDEIATMLRDR